MDNQTTREWLQNLSTLTHNPKSKIKWVEPTDLPPITIGQYCLNDDQVTRLLLALKQSSLDRPHPLVTTLKANCNPRVLDVFVWDLFERWLQVGAPSKEKWALIAVGLLGNDASVLKF